VAASRKKPTRNFSYGRSLFQKKLFFSKGAGR